MKGGNEPKALICILCTESGIYFSWTDPILSVLRTYLQANLTEAVKTWQSSWHPELSATDSTMLEV